MACRDTGKTSMSLKFYLVYIVYHRKKVVDAALGEIITTCSKMEWLLKHGEKALKPSKRSTPLLMIYKSSKVYHEPLGVVAAIVSWNYRTGDSFMNISFNFNTFLFSALHNAWSPILAAIFAGNGIVVKCSENVVWSTSWFVSVIQECLHLCGWDSDLVQVGGHLSGSL